MKSATKTTAKARSKNTAKTKLDLYQTVTDKIIKLLEKGVTPWRCPWNKYGFARNFATGHQYTGINAFLMNLTEHPIPYFMSFKQVKEKGGNIRKGAKSEMVFFYKSYYKDENNKTISLERYNTLQDNGEEAQRISFLKYFRVFNIADVEGIEIDIPEVELKQHEKIAGCEQIVKGYKDAPEMIFKDANRAYYAPISDQLNMPDLAQFESAEEYYCTLFHELTHSTGHQKRLNRKGITDLNPFATADYSKEELIAEMGASFLCAKAGIDVQPITENSAAYLQGWLKVLKADKKFIFKSAAKAQAATDYILGNQRF